MRVLLDTHALLWWAHEPERLTETALETIANEGNTVFVSAVSAMEIATKYRSGKLGYETPLSDSFLVSINGFGFEPLSINCAHAERAGNMKGDHKDPWDRLLAAQSEIERMPLVTLDKHMADWNVRAIW